MTSGADCVQLLTEVYQLISSAHLAKAIFCYFRKTAENNSKTNNKCDCNVRQKTLQKFLKISIKNSKCAVSNKHIQDGRPGRYENRRGSKIKKKHHQKTQPTTQERECPRCHHPEGVRIRNSAI